MKHNGERATQLAAIMLTDIAGYSRLMEEDEERTIMRMDRLPTNFPVSLHDSQEYK
ncbi:MAG: hypothetical protein ACLFP4_01845 [Spirochaetales bacterium]